MIKLSKRMKAVASMVTPGNRLCDVGTDHGYVPIALLQRGKITSAIAMDINEGPLSKAKENIIRNNLTDKVQIRLSDGTHALEIGEVDTILIAGMGGELIIRILQEGEEVCKSVDEIILQPQSDIDKVRKYIRDNGYNIVDEDMVFEDGKYYPMMKIVLGEYALTNKKLSQDIINVCDIYGPFLLKNGHPVLRKYLVKQHSQLNNILENLMKQKETDKITNRIEEIKREINFNESAYSIMGAIKNAGI